jgi:hypothetical protein
VAPGLTRWRASLRAGALLPLGPGPGDARGLRDLPVWGVAGIARPGRFRALLESEGARVVGFSAYRDHHRFSAAEVAREEDAARGAGALLLTTEKDAVRIEPHAAPGAPWRVLPIRVEVEGGWDALAARLLGPQTEAGRAARGRPPGSGVREPGV